MDGQRTSQRMLFPRPETGFRKKYPPARNQVIANCCVPWVLGTVGFDDVFVFISGMTRTTGSEDKPWESGGICAASFLFRLVPPASYVLNRFTLAPPPHAL